MHDLASVQRCTLHQLQAMLAEIQPRLGTAAEGPDDMARVRAIAHQVCNLLTAATLLQREPEGPATQVGAPAS